MIEARIERELLMSVQHNVLHSILFIKALRAAGVPVIGNIVINGIERGMLEMTTEADMDGDITIVRWYDTDEDASVPSWRKVDWGNEKGYSWIRFIDARKPVVTEPVKSDPDDWDEDDL